MRPAQKRGNPTHVNNKSGKKRGVAEEGHMKECNALTGPKLCSGSRSRAKSRQDRETGLTTLSKTREAGGTPSPQVEAKTGTYEMGVNQNY